MGAAGDVRHLPVLVGLLALRALRETAREVLLAFGDRGLSHLQEALADPSLPRAVRIHLPRTISRFPAADAARLLLHHLPLEPSGTVRYKILRGLGRLVANQPQLELDAKIVDDVIARQLAATLQTLHWQIVLQQGAEDDDKRRTTGHELLIDLLQQKEAFALERLFRALGLRHRGEDLAQIYAGLGSPDAGTRASSRELLHGVLPAEMRGAVIGLTDEIPPAERLAAARAFYDPEPIEYDALVSRLVAEPSESVACVAAYHAAELGLGGTGRPSDPRQVDRSEWLAALQQGAGGVHGANAAAGGRA